jgi:hypothetical protein
MSAGRQLGLATAAFTLCCYAWALLGPLGPDLQDALDLSDFQTSAMVAVPVLLGSLMRIPLGWLSDRFGGRRVFTALMAFTPLPLIALALWHDSLGAILALGFLLGFAGASFAVGVPFVNGWHPPERQGFALGIYGVGMGGTVLAGLTAPSIADEWGLSAPFWIAAALVAVMCVVFWLGARDAPRAPATSPAQGMFAALSVFRSSGRAWAADPILLPRLWRLRRDVPLPAQAAHGRARPDEGRRRGARCRVCAARRDRAPARGMALRPRRRGPRPARLVHGSRGARPGCSRRPTPPWSRSPSPVSRWPFRMGSAPGRCSSSSRNGSPTASARSPASSEPHVD